MSECSPADDARPGARRRHTLDRGASAVSWIALQRARWPSSPMRGPLGFCHCTTHNRIATRAERPVAQRHSSREPAAQRALDPLAPCAQHPSHLRPTPDHCRRPCVVVDRSQDRCWRAFSQRSTLGVARKFPQL